MWVFRFRETRNIEGTLVRKQTARQVCPVQAPYSSLKAVKKHPEVIRLLGRLNDGKRSPESVVTLGDFMDTIYLPFVDEQKRPSTARGYRAMWRDHLTSRCGSSLLCDVRTVTVQSWLEQIAPEDQTKKGTRLSRESLKHLKSFLSGIFAHAKRQGFYDGINPAQDTATPPAPEGEETHAYSLEEISAMLKVLPEPALTLVATAALTGARRGELNGMTWENYRNGEIFVARSIWNGHVTEPKTRKSKAPIPVIGYLAKLLDAHRQREGNPIAGPVFRAVNGQPLSLNNILNRAIKPALRKAGIEWHGWHAFRRGLGSNLNRLGVSGKTIQAILRHANRTFAVEHSGLS
jgi:integrase